MMKTSSVILTCMLSLNTLVYCSTANAVDTRVGAEAMQTSQESPAVSEVSSHLTSGDWKYSKGEVPFRTTFMYTFSSDGSYTLRRRDDVSREPEKGEWRLTSDDKGKTHLTLKNKTGKYYWLPQDCIIGYDESTDSMLISGGHFIYTQKLEKMVKHKPGK